MDIHFVTVILSFVNKFMKLFENESKMIYHFY